MYSIFQVLLFAMLVVIITKRPVEGDEVEVDLESVRHASKFTNQMNIDFKELQGIVCYSFYTFILNFLHL